MTSQTEVKSNRGKFKKFLLRAAFILVCSIVVFKLFFPTYTHRYRLTVNVDDAGTIRSASSVIEVTWHGQPQLGDASPFVPTVNGEAVLVELDSGKALSTALYSSGLSNKGVEANFLAMENFAAAGDRAGLIQITLQTGKRIIAPINLPPFIYFSQKDDPKTAKSISIDDLPKIAGANIKFVSAEIEMTSAPVSHTIQTKLPWLRNLIEQKGTHRIRYPNQFFLDYIYFLAP